MKQAEWIGLWRVSYCDLIFIYELEEDSIDSESGFYITKPWGTLILGSAPGSKSAKRTTSSVCSAGLSAYLQPVKA